MNAPRGRIEGSLAISHRTSMSRGHVCDDIAQQGTGQRILNIYIGAQVQIVTNTFDPDKLVDVKPLCITCMFACKTQRLCARMGDCKCVCACVHATVKAASNMRGMNSELRLHIHPTSKQCEPPDIPHS